ncbi:hypothetical protein [Jiulongibacter sp. NS-SX5]|uniref:hypothetical protein n=1 Tax=Jiulongibacter sp. NS-SX5 TaxID=3463854 RepID=UPI00405A01E8
MSTELNKEYSRLLENLLWIQSELASNKSKIAGLFNEDKEEHTLLQSLDQILSFMGLAINLEDQSPSLDQYLTLLQSMDILQAKKEVQPLLSLSIQKLNDKIESLRS